MAQNYTRQSSMADGDTITAALFNNEYNQLVNAFAYSSSSASSTGHRHDGSAGQGGNIPQIGDLDFLNKVVVDGTNNRVGFFVEVSSSAVEQVRIQDGAIVPVTDNDIDLGTSSLEFKDGYFDGTVYADAINFNGTAITATAAELNIMDGVTSTAAEINLLDGVTATTTELNYVDTGASVGTVVASKVVTVDANKDVSSFRNITLTGELDAGSLDISGDADIDGTLETDALSINGTTVTATAAELNILDGVTSTAAELNILDGVTSTTAELNILDGVTSTAAELNILDGKAFLDEDDMSSNSATGIASQQSIKAYVDSQVTAQDLDFQADSGGALSIDLDSETLTFTGGTGIDTSGSGNAVTFDIDSTVATLTGTQTLTNKTLTSPDINTPDIDGGTIDGAVIGGSSAAAGSFTTGSFSSDVSFADSSKAIFGTGGDGLEIYHNGSNSFIDDAGTGNLQIRANAQVKIQKYTGENMFVGIADGAASMYYDNVQRIATTSTGCQVTGSVTADTLETSTASGGLISVIRNDPTIGTNNSLGAIYWKSTEDSGTTVNIGAGILALADQNHSTTASGSRLSLQTTAVSSTSPTERLRIGATGDISFYDGSGNAGFFWDSSKASVGIGTTGLTPTDGSNIELSSATSARVILDSTGTGGRKWTMATGTSGSLDFYDYDASAYRLRIDASGFVGINRTSPSGLLHIQSDAGSNAQLYVQTGDTSTKSQLIFGDSGDSNTGGVQYDHSDDSLQFHVGNVGEKMRLSSDALIVGTTDSATYNFESGGGTALWENGLVAAAKSGAVVGIFNRTSSDGDILQFRKNGSAVGSIGVVSADRMYFSTADGLGLQLDKDNSRIVPVGADGSTFNNNVSLGSSGLEFKNLYLSGNATHGTTPSSSAAGIKSEAVGRTTYSRGSAVGGFGHLIFINGNGTVGSVTTSGSATAYNTSSDYRLKENVSAMTQATERLKQLLPKRFNFIADADTTVDGFLAHEVADVVPEAITGTKDGMRDEEYEVKPAVLDDDGNVVDEAVMGTRSVPDYQGIDQSKLVPLLVATIQELEARITQLENN